MFANTSKSCKTPSFQESKSHDTLGKEDRSIPPSLQLNPGKKLTWKNRWQALQKQLCKWTAVTKYSGLSGFWKRFCPFCASRV